MDRLTTEYEEIIEEEEVIYEEKVVESNSDEELVYKCSMCHVEKIGQPFEHKDYCESCYEHLQQAYRWLQSPMISANELKELQDRIMDLTDIEKISFD